MRKLFQKKAEESTNMLAGNVEGLPPSVIVDRSYPVTFTFTNNSASPISSMAVISDYPSDFSVSSDTCSNISQLDAGASCSISGNLVPTSAGSTETVTAGLSSYNNTLMELSTSTAVQGGFIIAEITTPFPGTVTANSGSISTAIKFTNISSDTTATISGTQINSSDPVNAPTGGVTDRCYGMSLAPGASCTISFSLTIQAAGTYTVTTVLSYSPDDGFSPLNIPQTIIAQ